MRQDYWGQHALQDYASIIDEDQLDVHELAAVVDFDEPELVTVGDIDTMDAFLGGLPLEAVMYESGGVRLTQPRNGDVRAEREYKKLFRQYMDVLRADNEVIREAVSRFEKAHNALVTDYWSSLSIDTLAKLLNMLSDVRASAACRLTDD